MKLTISIEEQQTPEGMALKLSINSDPPTPEGQEIPPGLARSMVGFLAHQFHVGLGLITEVTRPKPPAEEPELILPVNRLKNNGN